MSSLTPLSRSGEVVSEATHEGLMNGLLTLVPTSGALYVALQRSEAFVKRTNWQSRTAMVIMPALFVFAYTSEHKLSNKMKEIAQESRQSSHLLENRQALSDPVDAHMHLTDLYQQSKEQSDVCVVPGNKLGLHHRFANYAAENPIKVLAGIAVPSVASIFYGKSGSQHLDFSVKLMHTRVFGQFATLSLLLSVMGFKEYMDRNGKFVTEAEMLDREKEMQRVRAALTARLQQQREAAEAAEREIALAHEQDLQEKN